MTYAVPVLAALVDDRRPNASDLGSLADAPLSAAAAVFNRMELKGHVTSQWLTKVNLSEQDARDLIRTGNTTSPVFGLLRSARGSNVSLEDIEMMLAHLRSSMPNSYLPLRKRAANLSTDIDPRRPWASGYELARNMRARMEMDIDANVNIESELERLGVVIHDLAFADDTIRGACVGCPQFCPAVFVNSNSADASGVSGRRTTLAHELCHLLFDRSLMRSLARLEGLATEQDRILEMRANAFAVAFLVPMESLLDEHGNVVDDERVREISVTREVSMHALERHAQNLRRLIHSPY
jgi:Zn-dependent peptidase ImmA (M78 family)